MTSAPRRGVRVHLWFLNFGERRNPFEMDFCGLLVVSRGIVNAKTRCCGGGLVVLQGAIKPKTAGRRRFRSGRPYA